MAIFPRKNPPPVQISLLNEVASRTLDWSRAVRVEKMEEAYKLERGVYSDNSGKDAKYSNRFRLLVPGAIYVHQNNFGDTDVSIIVCNNTNGDRIYTAAGTMSQAGSFAGFITPIIKTNTLVVATKSSAETDADLKNFYMVFVPTLSSVGITGLANFLVYVDKFAPLNKLAKKHPVPSDLLL